MKPIIMSAESVRAILDGRKTQTRRVIKPQPWWIEPPHLEGDKWVGAYSTDPNITNPTYEAHCPFPVGAEVWVREKWCPYADEMTKAYCQAHDPEWGEPVKPAVYAADYEPCDPLDVGGCEKWSSPVTMPRWASRITLEVTGVRAERLQDIAYPDIVAEGYPDPNHPYPARMWYMALWDSINGKRYPWDSNPWVWVVEFRRIQ